jgi:hypothetical protein
METSGDGEDAVTGAAAAILVAWINIPNKSNRSRKSKELRAASVVIVPPIVRWAQPCRHSKSRRRRHMHRWIPQPLPQSRVNTVQSYWQIHTSLANNYTRGEMPSDWSDPNCC